ncbi:MAG TPA: F0F1 ATP synthase subunit delta, partial [Candidatus Binatia bacterium]|nr:F0F1 ATP synthase subunit delta [Candidatus Binatia bacterium]
MSAVARRYAKALFELGQQQGDFEAVGRELADVVKVFEQPLLRRFAEQSTLDRANRRTVVARLAGRLGASQLIAKFLGVLA